MLRSISINTPFLRPLSNLSLLSLPNLAYSRSLISSNDQFIAAGAWAQLIDGGVVAPPLWDDMLAASQWAMVRRKAVTFADKASERDLARRLSDVHVEPIDLIRQRKMLAELAFDYAAAADAAGALYLATGDLEFLLEASRHAEAAHGWLSGVEWVVRLAAIVPLDPRAWGRLLVLVKSANQPKVLQEIADIMMAANLYPQFATIFGAWALLQSGNAEACLARLEPLSDQRVLGDPIIAPMLHNIIDARARSHELLGNWEMAFDLFRKSNTIERSPFDPRNYYANADRRDRLTIPGLPPGKRSDIVQMLGFPRSGTTLLENALAAHPMIETFEEIPAVAAAYGMIERALGTAPGASPAVTDYIAARDKYYEQIDIRRTKPDAQVLVDKMPLRSAEAAFLAKLFPEWRYVFSIRHPYDVVLSCFKQKFAPNVAMENFRTIEDAARLYDYTMSRWFDVFSMTDPRVHYVRYDDLVTNFEPTIRATLEFVGVEWNSDVLDFAEASKRRAARTPSYQKVRQGLSIGVQTSWRNYNFVFDSPAAKPLMKWVTFFGFDSGDAA
ncbi:MAG: sulfotransferase [Hyphomicrobiales bacterium]|nr:MAG: sulfotransferase [Hyphomicrobiales bacterium]